MPQLNLPNKIDCQLYNDSTIIENSIIIAFLFFNFVSMLYYETWTDTQGTELNSFVK